MSTLAFPLVALFLLAPDQVKVNARPGGKMTVDHGTPTWRDEFQTALSPGQAWRLGANGATTWTTEAGLIFDDLVVFPGTYDLAAAPQSDQTWHLIFHHDGNQYRRETGEGHAVLAEAEVSKKEFAKSLTVEIEPDKKAGKGVYRFRATFGPRRMEGTFRSAKAKTLKGKVGSERFTSTVLLRTDVDDLAERVANDFVPLARLEVTPRKGDPRSFRVFVKGGDSPALALVPPGGSVGSAATISGQSGGASAAKTVEHSIESTDAGADLVFEVGEHSFHFPVTEADLGG